MIHSEDYKGFSQVLFNDDLDNQQIPAKTQGKKFPITFYASRSLKERLETFVNDLYAREVGSFSRDGFIRATLKAELHKRGY